MSLADLPVIVSGREIGFLDPQEKLWKGDTGRQYELTELYNSSIMTAIEGLANFRESQGSYYPHTIIRLPLRTAPSNLSEQVYDTDKVHQLLTALKKEAKYLLLFLKSVNRIEVITISKHGQHTRSFQVAIDSTQVSMLNQERQKLLDQLHRAHKKYECQVSKSIHFTASFNVVVTDRSQASRSRWLVTTTVGSKDAKVLSTVGKLHIFPWVGTALELTANADGGRVFCFLPLPAKVTSNLPVHVNGTFSLNDERRTLKWASLERGNDTMAQWNQLLLTKLLPDCYLRLLLEANKQLSADQFYDVWPDPKKLHGTDWNDFLYPFYQKLFKMNCLWSSAASRWVKLQNAILVDRGKQQVDVVSRALTACNLSVVHIPTIVWEALDLCGERRSVQVIKPSLVRREIRVNKPSYDKECATEKLELLRYCLSDGKYSDLHGLALVPLASGKFTSFASTKLQSVRSANICYVCSEHFPLAILPNIESLLISVPDPLLQLALLEVAREQLTQLKLLGVHEVAKLLPQCFPDDWDKRNKVSIPCSSFPREWFERFWSWVQNYDLSYFVDLLVLPLAMQNTKDGFQVTRLVPTSKSKVVLISEDCPPEQLSALVKLQVDCTILKYIRYVNHPQISQYVHRLSEPSEILHAFANANPRHNSIQAIDFKQEEAVQLQTLLSSKRISSLASFQKNVLQNLSVFWTLTSASLVSIDKAKEITWDNEPVLEPPGFEIVSVNLPDNLVIFSRSRNDLSLFEHYETDVSKPSNMVDLVQRKIFPMIRARIFPDSKTNAIMEDVLQLLPVLQRQQKYGITELIKNLPFLQVDQYKRKAPIDLYDPTVVELSNLFEGESVFPMPPFGKKEKNLHPLRECGLRTSVGAKDLVSILTTISARRASSPKAVSIVTSSRAEAVIAYISSHPSLLSEFVSYSRRFDEAFKALSTNYNCLPVINSPPAEYPKALSWTGTSCSNHLVSLSANVVVCEPRHLNTLSSIVGSQMYFVVVPSPLSTAMCGPIPVNAVLAHFKHVMESRGSIDGKSVSKVSHQVYKHLKANLGQLRSEQHSCQDLGREEWIWLEKQERFVKPDLVVLEEHPTFNFKLEPYIYQLPEDLHQYQLLFTEYGMHRRLSTSLIISVLKMMKEDKTDKVSPSKSWAMVKYVLNWLTDDGQKPVSQKLSSSDNIYVPVDSNSARPQLVDITQIVYTDLEYLKSFHSSKDKKLQFIHKNVAHLAQFLGAKGLSKQLNISLDAFGDVGPHEPLVTRLKNILRDYKDGLTIIKELLQNADDAGATEVNICHDTRSHTTDPTTLLFPGMARCHGPALIVHNNAEFSKEDFLSITKLAGATKQSKHLKIGKFGVGFCSVYHITDIPSFVSGDWLYIFDPTVGYLQNEIEDKARPGKKLRTIEELVGHSQQLDPYVGLYGFERNKSYRGTLFRFPFRTTNSNLSSIQYDSTLIERLVNDIKTAGSKLLLFLRNLKRITFSRIDKKESKIRLILSIEKECKSTVTSAAESTPETLKCVEILSVNVTDHQHSSSQQEMWLSATYSGVFTSNGCSKIGTSTVACPVETVSSVDTTNSSQRPYRADGEMFCFLPLSPRTGLPVHVSSNFAVMNDRTGIHSCDRSDLSRSSESQWNLDLMQAVIPKAYHMLLLAVKHMCEAGIVSTDEYDFTSLWPLRNSLKIKNPWDELIQPVYQLIADTPLFHSLNIERWLPMKDIKILSPDVLCSALKPSTPQCVIEVVQGLNYSLVYLGIDYQRLLPIKLVRECCIDEQEFLDIFFSNMKQLTVSAEVRNEVLFLLFLTFAETESGSLSFSPFSNSGNKRYLKNFLTKHRCIPCTPTGLILKCCSEVVDPKVYFAQLYDRDDGMFPVEKFNNDIVRVAMSKLGMISRTLPWAMLIERAETIKHLYSQNKVNSMERVTIILQCIENNIKSTSMSSFSFPQLPNDAKLLTRIAFLPVMERPKKYPTTFKWAGDGHSLLSCQEVIHGERNSRLAGSQAMIVCDSSPKHGGCGEIPHNVLRALKIKSELSCSMVVEHLCYIADSFTELISEDKEVVRSTLKWLEEACSDIFKFLESQLSESVIKNDGLQELNQRKCLWTGKKFIAPSSVASKWNLNGPYLYKIPPMLENKPNLISALKIQEKFDTDKLLATLKKLHDEFQDIGIGQREMKLVVAAVSELDETIFEFIDAEKVVYLPDEASIMRDTKTLACNDAVWCKVETECYFVHYKIPRPVALKLRVKPVLAKALEVYESPEQHFDGVEFGQHEELTERIKTILSEYPFGITVIKELLQNADDAKATRMYVILDKRTHATKTLPSHQWKDLQGPALLVWNDSGFSKEDLKGIQKLGLGSKRSKSEAIGQYGIGFNAVYHLTDCPSFITNGDSMTLCVLDPHVRYIPGANTLKPGRMYENLGDKFWNNWSDLKAPYLREGLKKCPQEIRETGSLFRFPLRYKKELVEKSELLDEFSDDSWLHDGSGVLSALKMEDYLNKWAPKMKDALVFLNHVSELKFFVIDDHAMFLTYHYKVDLDQDAKSKRFQIQCDAVKFAMDGENQPTSVSYPLVLSERTPKQESTELLVQRGVGDCMNREQHWEYLKQIKPNHGLATPINKLDFKGRVFCFLPLSMNSNLPVHVNGNFVLDAARSGLWKSRDLNDMDDKSKWNSRLIEAIASSYSQFVVICQSSHVSSPHYSDKKKMMSDIQNYYRVFPYGRVTTSTHCTSEDDSKNLEVTPRGVMKELADYTYKKLYALNPRVHIIIQKVESDRPGDNQFTQTNKHTMYSFDWLPLRNETEPSKQAYFWKPTSDKSKAVTPVLKKIGLVLSPAPIWIRKHFREVGYELPEATPTSVFQYYCSYNQQVTSTGTFPCTIDDTLFENVQGFTTFSDYILNTKPDHGGILEFPDNPFGFPLLVTADQKLRLFSKEAPVIYLSCDYTSLFHNSCDKFIHPLLNQFKYSKSYFLEPSEENWSIIQDILTTTIPESLHNIQMVVNFNKHFERDELKQLWKCLVNEPVFREHLKEILQEWTLILSRNGQLFACQSSDQLLPVIPPKNPDEESYSSGHRRGSEHNLDFEIYELLSKHGMPVIDTDVCDLVRCQKYCPQFCHPENILKNIFHLHSKGGMKSLWVSFVPSTNDKLLRYLAKIHFRQKETSLLRVKSLPIFCDITSHYRSLKGEVFIWPGIVCRAGSDKWLHLLSTVFLEEDGPWNTLSTAEVLGIERISPLTVYTRFVFPHFHLLTQEERIVHLKHIRDTHELFKTAYNDSKKEESIHTHRGTDATLFIAALEQLPCLPIGNELKPLCDFCDPQATFFETFPEAFDFPPEELCDDTWLSFFRKIGLRTKPATNEFTSYCQKVSCGQHKDILSASKILLECLCSDEDWHKNTGFLRQVSDIPFVCAHKLPRLSWIRSACPAKNIIQKGKKSFDLTTLRGSIVCSSTNSKIAWTVKSVVELPTLPYYGFTKLEAKECIETFCNNIGISPTPSCNDVVRNLCNIAETKFSKYELFEQYPENFQAPKRGFPLLDVVSQHFLFLKAQDVPYGMFEKLRDIACIAVSQDGNVAEIVKPVLVKPIGVVASHSQLLKGLLPVLNPLPNVLYAVVPGMLELLGVRNSIHLEQVQYALETIHQYIQIPFDPNTIRMIELLLKQLYVLLSTSMSETSASAIKCPLYLPNKSGTLVESRSLLFDDIGYHRGGHFELKQVPYSLMSLLVQRDLEYDKYEFSAKDLYSKLPENVRPIGLSMCCTRQLNDDCSVNSEGNQSELALKLKKALGFDQFSTVVMMILQSQENQRQACASFAYLLEEFIQKLKIFTVVLLKIDILLTLVSPPAKIGTAMVDFHLEQNEDDYCLYINSTANPLKLNLIENLAKRITSAVVDKGLSDQNTLREPDKVISMVLRADNPQQLQDLLHDLGIKSSELQFQDTFEEEFNPKVGDPILESWHHRLQSDINNYFRPQEMAGLEVAEEQYIYVRVEHLISHSEKPPGPSHDIDQESENEEEVITELDKYLIWLNDDDEETKIVSVIDLFKILRIKQVNLDDGSTELILYDSESEAVKAWDSVKGDKLKEIMKSISAELHQISRLSDEDQKRKAIKAMYLKWHPDKNSHPLATKAFQFLRRQINRLEQGLPLEVPDDDFEVQPDQSPHPDWFQWWDEIVRIRVERFNRERTRRTHDRVSSGDWTGRIHVHPEPNTARLWLKQAEHDLTALRILLERVDDTKEVSAHTCFLACQVAEKSLKAGMYQVCGLQPEGLVHHKFVGYAGALEQERKSLTPGLHTLSRSLESYYIKTRYPNAYSPPCVPSTTFGPSKAREAEMIANRILDMMKKVLHV